MADDLDMTCDGCGGIGDCYCDDESTEWQRVDALRAHVKRLREQSNTDRAEWVERLNKLGDDNHRLGNERDDLQRKLAESREAYAVRGVEMDRLNTELNKRKGDPVTRLHNICEGIDEDADGSEWSREEWERIDKENLELRNKLKQFAAWVLRRGHPPSETDGACSQCYPGGDILIEGFVCVYHEAVTLCDHEFADTKHCVKCGWEPETDSP